MSDESQNADPEAELEDGSIIPEEDFREAIAVCRKDPSLDRYFKMAPPGAKLFIGLWFYSTHFGNKVDPRKYAECQAEIEPSLAINDLEYLIRFERDKNTKQYLRGLLAQRKAEAASEETLPAEPIQAQTPLAPPATEIPAEPAPPKEPSSPKPDDVPPSPPARKRRRKVSASNAQAYADPEMETEVAPMVFKFVAAIVLVLGCLLAFYFSYKAAVNASAQSQDMAQADSADNEPMPIPSKTARADRRPARQAARPKKASIGKDSLAAARTILQEEEPAQRNDESQADAPDETADKTATANESKSHGRKQHVVFTDGKKIVRRPGGKIEVPRVFSCAGAGIKPFWVYGAHPEADAAKEKKAREEWQELVRQAGESASL